MTMDLVTAVIGLAIGLGIGLVAGARRGAARQRELFDAEIGAAQNEADRIIEDARSRAEARLKESRVEAKEQLLEKQSELEREIKEQRDEINEIERKLRKREENLDRKSDSLESRDNELKGLRETLEEREKTLEARIERTRELEEDAKAKLEAVAGLTADEARQSLIDEMVGEAKLEANKRVKQIEEDAESEAEKRAKKIISTAIQRYAGDYVTERCVSTVSLPSDDMKGRIIGREGRNIRALEAATGVDLIIDDTPEAVVVSAFDPVRRQIASLSLRRLIADGRIHPGRIEEVVGKVKREIDQVIKESGEQAAFELGLHGLHKEVLRMLGRLRYRTSYGQNMWSHAIEVGWLCGMMAAELGLPVKQARRAGLLHDIGKAMDHEQEGSHAIIGADFCKKHGEDDLIVNAIAAHHNEVPAESVTAHLVMSADALSGARPGARREILETYVQRLEDIERISRGFDGVDKCYTIQAGREVRIIVDNARVDDDQAAALSRDIARKIEQDLTYPGQIKVCVIRETRSSEYAR